MTPLLPQLPKGFGRKNWLKCCPFFSLAIPFSQALFLFSSSLLFRDPKKLHLSWLIMGFPFYYTCSNDSMSAVYQGRSKKFQSFLWISCMSLYMTCWWTRGGRSYYPKSFSRFNQMEKKLIWGQKTIFGIFVAFLSPPPHFTCKLFTFLDFFYSLRPYKCIGIELDLFPQLTTKNSVYIFIIVNTETDKLNLPFHSNHRHNVHKQRSCLCT